MKHANRVRRIGLVLALAGASAGQAQTMESHQEFICTSGAEKRVVSIFNRNALDRNQASDGCRVDYTKAGQTRTVWTSRNDHAYCVAKAVSLVTKLAEDNFTCMPTTVERADEHAPQQEPVP
jgi:hypothetical protein